MTFPALCRDFSNALQGLSLRFTVAFPSVYRGFTMTFPSVYNDFSSGLPLALPSVYIYFELIDLASPY